MIIKTWRDPYDAGFSPTRPKEIEINPGVTVLVGCNGTGKTTLIRNINESARRNHIPCHMFDGQHDSADAMQLMIGYGEFDDDDRSIGALLYTSSEGEALQMNIYRHAKQFNKFIKHGEIDTRQSRLARVMRMNTDSDENKIGTNIRILLFDAADSGLSIDVVIDMKRVFESMIKRAEKDGIELYIIIAANEYELCIDEPCFDVASGKYCTFSTYDDFKSFIMESRHKKEKRLEKQNIWREKIREKELKECHAEKIRIDAQIQEIKDLAISENRELTHWERRTIYEYKEQLDDVIHHCRFVKKSDIIQSEEDE